jgi:EAL domain-containing protein (putative c-di-GMP-specific phosphodiesterase class I)
VLRDLGVEWVQGYYLGRPGPLPATFGTRGSLEPSNPS